MTDKNCYTCKHAKLTKHDVGDWSCRCSSRDIMTGEEPAKILCGLEETCEFWQEKENKK